MSDPLSATVASNNDNENLGPLPPGWEQMWDPELRQSFFIDHNSKTTTVRPLSHQETSRERERERERDKEKNRKDSLMLLVT